jgi:hypothetical protein
MIYNGMFRELVPQIVELFRDGKTPLEIAKAMPQIKAYGHMQVISAQMVAYILRRERVLVYPDGQQWDDSNAFFVENFRRLWCMYDRHPPMIATQTMFELLAERLYLELEGLIRALEARK